jgi:hypothetical protein
MFSSLAFKNSLNQETLFYTQKGNLKHRDQSNEKDLLSTFSIEEWYNHFKGVNVLDMSKEGEEAL